MEPEQEIEALRADNGRLRVENERLREMCRIVQGELSDRMTKVEIDRKWADEEIRRIGAQANWAHGVLNQIRALLPRKLVN